MPISKMPFLNATPVRGWPSAVTNHLDAVPAPAGQDDGCARPGWPGSCFTRP